MLQLRIILDGDGAFEDWKGREAVHLANDAQPMRVCGLADGMASGAPSVAIGIDLGDRVVIAETSLALFLAAAAALRARYGEPHLVEGDQCSAAMCKRRASQIPVLVWEDEQGRRWETTSRGVFCSDHAALVHLEVKPLWEKSDKH